MNGVLLGLVVRSILDCLDPTLDFPSDRCLLLYACVSRPGVAAIRGGDRSDWARAAYVNEQNHTKSCTSCQGALKNVKKMLTTAKTAAVISFTWVSSMYTLAWGVVEVGYPVLAEVDCSYDRTFLCFLHGDVRPHRRPSSSFSTSSGR